MGIGKRLTRETSGQEIAEAAFILPLLFMILFAILWFARAFNIYATVNRAASEAAHAAVSRTCATCGNTAYADIKTTVVDPILLASHLDPAQGTLNLSDPFTINPASNPAEHGI